MQNESSFVKKEQKPNIVIKKPTSLKTKTEQGKSINAPNTLKQKYTNRLNYDNLPKLEEIPTANYNSLSKTKAKKENKAGKKNNTIKLSNLDKNYKKEEKERKVEKDEEKIKDERPKKEKKEEEEKDEEKIKDERTKIEKKEKKEEEKKEGDSENVDAEMKKKEKKENGDAIIQSNYELYVRKRNGFIIPQDRISENIPDVRDSMEIDHTTEEKDTSFSRKFDDQSDEKKFNNNFEYQTMLEEKLPHIKIRTDRVILDINEWLSRLSYDSLKAYLSSYNVNNLSYLYSSVLNGLSYARISRTSNDEKENSKERVFSYIIILIQYSATLYSLFVDRIAVSDFDTDYSTTVETLKENITSIQDRISKWGSKEILAKYPKLEDTVRHLTDEDIKNTDVSGVILKFKEDMIEIAISSIKKKNAAAPSDIINNIEMFIDVVWYCQRYIETEEEKDEKTLTEKYKKTDINRLRVFFLCSINRSCPSVSSIINMYTSYCTEMTSRRSLRYYKYGLAYHGFQTVADFIKRILESFQIMKGSGTWTDRNTSVDHANIFNTRLEKCFIALMTEEDPFTGTNTFAISRRVRERETSYSLKLTDVFKIDPNNSVFRIEEYKFIQVEDIIFSRDALKTHSSSPESRWLYMPLLIEEQAFLSFRYMHPPSVIRYDFEKSKNYLYNVTNYIDVMSTDLEGESVSYSLAKYEKNVRILDNYPISIFFRNLIRSIKKPENNRIDETSSEARCSIFLSNIFSDQEYSFMYKLYIVAIVLKTFSGCVNIQLLSKNVIPLLYTCILFEWDSREAWLLYQKNYYNIYQNPSIYDTAISIQKWIKEDTQDGFDFETPEAKLVNSPNEISGNVVPDISDKTKSSIKLVLTSIEKDMSEQLQRLPSVLSNAMGTRSKDINTDMILTIARRRCVFITSMAILTDKFMDSACGIEGSLFVSKMLMSFLQNSAKTVRNAEGWIASYMTRTSQISVLRDRFKELKTKTKESSEGYADIASYLSKYKEGKLSSELTVNSEITRIINEYEKRRSITPLDWCTRKSLEATDAHASLFSMSMSLERMLKSCQGTITQDVLDDFNCFIVEHGLSAGADFEKKVTDIEGIVEACAIVDISTRNISNYEQIKTILESQHISSKSTSTISSKTGNSSGNSNSLDVGGTGSGNNRIISKVYSIIPAASSSSVFLRKCIAGIQDVSFTEISKYEQDRVYDICDKLVLCSQMLEIKDRSKSIKDCINPNTFTGAALSVRKVVDEFVETDSDHIFFSANDISQCLSGQSREHYSKRAYYDHINIEKVFKDKLMRIWASSRQRRYFEKEHIFSLTDLSWLREHSKLNNAKVATLSNRVIRKYNKEKKIHTRNRKKTGDRDIGVKNNDENSITTTPRQRTQYKKLVKKQEEIIREQCSTELVILSLISQKECTFSYFRDNDLFLGKCAKTIDHSEKIRKTSKEVLYNQTPGFLLSFIAGQRYDASRVGSVPPPATTDNTDTNIEMCFLTADLSDTGYTRYSNINLADMESIGTVALYDCIVKEPGSSTVDSVLYNIERAEKYTSHFWIDILFINQKIRLVVKVIWKNKSKFSITDLFIRKE